MGEVIEFFQRIGQRVNPVFACIWAGICWAVFPDAAYVPAAIALGVAVVLDIITKYVALSVKHGGFWNALQTKAINSETMWRKSRMKIFTYLVVMILAGLSIRVAPLRTMGVFVATVVYSVIFIREFSSNLENMIDAGADWLKPLLFYMRRKEADMVKGDVSLQSQTMPGVGQAQEGDG